MMTENYPLIPNANEEPFSNTSEFCKQCSFKENRSGGEVYCLMNAIKNKWQTTGVVHYCDDPFSYKFIKMWNSKFQSKPLNVVIPGDKQ